MGSRTRLPCENEATVPYCGSGEPDVCEQHARELDLSHDLEEFEIARDYVAGFAKVAEASACRRLTDLMDAAWAECEMRLAVIGAERQMLWEVACTAAEEGPAPKRDVLVEVNSLMSEAAELLQESYRPAQGDERASREALHALSGAGMIVSRLLRRESERELSEGDGPPESGGRASA